MIFQELNLSGAFLISSEPFEDHRGFFLRTFCKEHFEGNNLISSFVQANHSGTAESGSIRGMHFQYPPYSEVKLVRCIKGAIFDVIIDLRQSSKTFLQWEGVELNEDNRYSMYVPEGFAHGFQSLTDNSEIVYMVSQVYNKASEGGVRFDDPAVNIKWKKPLSQISEKDLSIPFLDKNFKGIAV
jgi:dTDP-4-dehydrorhamnose 3,5-epimerase